ncbi:MAG: hypothetical protein JXB48_19745 [Candidatus Latescibacteria bacterium]|nr:hypothetical protein [Candidatus Latescibacterota bacterium]
MGPLKPHPQNPRYFADPSGKSVYLTGLHTWNNLRDMGKTDPPPAFDYRKYLDFLEERDLNFIRLWSWDLTRCKVNETQIFAEQFPWQRTGPGTALDGKPKFNLDTFDDTYFRRLRSRVEAAEKRGIYVSVMLFEGWALHASEEPWCWDGHPFNSKNNINGIDGDPDGDGRGIETHTLDVPEVLELQKRYVGKVIDTLNDLDNVLYEITNESGVYSTVWQYHMIDFIHEYERNKNKQHPVGMTFQYNRDKANRGTNAILFDSPADWISPNPEGGYQDNPPASDGSKIIITDTDHLWGIGGNRAWVWKSFCRGLNPIFMDRYGYVEPKKSGGENKPVWADYLSPVPENDPQFDSLRDNLGYAKSYADRMDLALAAPMNDLCSTGYCLANPGYEYLVYAPEGGTFTLSFDGTEKIYRIEWMNPENGSITSVGNIRGKNTNEFTSPFQGDAVLYLITANE